MCLCVCMRACASAVCVGQYMTVKYNNVVQHDAVHDSEVQQCGTS